MTAPPENAATARPAGSKRKIRVLQVTPTFYPEVGGIETVIEELTAHLGHYDIESEIAHLSLANKTLQKEIHAGRCVWRVPLIGSRLIGLAPQLRKISEDFDLLHVHDPQLAAITASVMLFGRAKPAVLSTHGGYYHTSQLGLAKAIHEKILMRPALKRYGKVLASSAADYAWFKNYSTRVSLCSNGVNIERFQLPSKTLLNANRWIYWGRLSRNKRLDRVIACVAQARKAGAAVDLCICGPDFDGLQQELKRQIVDAGLTKCVELKPFLSIEALRDELASRAVFITASEHEGFGLSIVEAMAAGCLIICRDMDPLNRFVRDGENGLFLDFDGGVQDEARLARFLAMGESTVVDASKASEKRAASYSWQTAVVPFVDAYHQALD
ncbi:hypothetical protein UP09_07205 [Bradyrhizobium sp. LTSP885]|uniref:glycosyltransferase family 4 protein n=1 Tax=Bradyrhizobium sp. LTSP885 TaxID=1619232 RepID=UPI0005CA904F|nr:glycosyltransferase family 4 protein [Bradyrhizobium sp. LTSP885]KJC49479.1 hypothetical protein UP09_07205 [Bradyrhizobium sp. LTSP885]